jgi:hypothetical protein
MCLMICLIFLPPEINKFIKKLGIPFTKQGKKHGIQPQGGYAYPLPYIQNTCQDKTKSNREPPIIEKCLDSLENQLPILRVAPPVWQINLLISLLHIHCYRGVSHPGIIVAALQLLCQLQMQLVHSSIPDRQSDDERGPLAFFAGDIQPPAVPGNDVVGNAQS